MSSKVKPLLIFLLFIMVAPVWSQQMTSEEIDNRIKQDSGDAKKCLKQLTKLCPNQKFGPPCFKQVMPTLPPRCGEILGSNFGSKVASAATACQDDIERLCPISVDALLKDPSKASRVIASCIQKKKKQLSIRCRRALGGYK